MRRGPGRAPGAIGAVRMKLAITGAAGFLGRYTVAEALRRGHQVQALVRPGRAGPAPGPIMTARRSSSMTCSMIRPDWSLTPDRRVCRHPPAAKAGASEATPNRYAKPAGRDGRGQPARPPGRHQLILGLRLSRTRRRPDARRGHAPGVHPQRRDAYAQAKLQQNNWCATTRPRTAGSVRCFGLARSTARTISGPLAWANRFLSRLWLRIGAVRTDCL